MRNVFAGFFLLDTQEYIIILRIYPLFPIRLVRVTAIRSFCNKSATHIMSNELSLPDPAVNCANLEINYYKKDEGGIDRQTGWMVRKTNVWP